MRAGSILLLLLIARPLSAVTLSASSVAGVDPGDIATVCVTLATGGAEVAGTQNDLVWDGRCLTLPDTGSCYASGMHSKSLQGRLLDNRDFTYRALILSLSDVDPIEDGVLYCCDFIVEPTASECCRVEIAGASASDPHGNALDVLAFAREVCTEPVFDVTPIIAATPTSSPTPTHTPIACSQCTPNDTDADDDGSCQVAAPAAGSVTGWPLVTAVLLAWLRRRRGV